MINNHSKLEYYIKVLNMKIIQVNNRLKKKN